MYGRVEGAKWCRSQVKPIDLNPDTVEQIFKNTERIHGKSEAIDWIKVAAHKTVEYLLKSKQNE